MKSNLLLTLCLLTTLFARAQFTQGQKMIGGQVSVNFYYNDLTSSPGSEQRFGSVFTSFSLSRFSSPTHFNGFGINYGYTYNHSNIGISSTEYIDRNNSIGIFVSGTKLKSLAGRFYLGFTGTSGLSYGFGRTTYASNGDFRRVNNYNLYVSGGLGLFYQLDQRFLLSANLINLLNLAYNYSHFSPNNSSNVYETNATSFTLSSGLNGFSLTNIAVGVRYMLKQSHNNKLN